MSGRHSRRGRLPPSGRFCIRSLSLCLGEARLAPLPTGSWWGRHRREPHPWCPFGRNRWPQAPVPPGCLQPWLPKPTWSAPPAAQASVLPVAGCRRLVHRRPVDVIAGHPSGDKMERRSSCSRCHGRRPGCCETEECVLATWPFACEDWARGGRCPVLLSFH